MLRAIRGAGLLALLLAVAACASGRPGPPGARAYDLERDSFAFANGTLWPRLAAAPDAAASSGYHHRCFVLARAARQFYLHARFEPGQPAVAAADYRARVREVVARDPRGDLAGTHPVDIPGYASLRAFSRDHEALLKDEIGSQLESYFHVGNWRLFLPFPRAHQERVAIQLQRMLQAGRPAVVHAVRFPIMTINHAVLVYDAAETAQAVRFFAYDPNQPDEPLVIRYERATRTFVYPVTGYFWGGPVNVYEIYRRGLF